MLSVFDRALKPTITAMESWANKEIERTRLGVTLQRVVTDGLFSMGIAKVALATPAEAAMLAFAQPAAQPFCERVDLDDFVFDVHARDWSEVSYIGHRYRVPLDAVKDSKIYERAGRDDLGEGVEDQLFNAEGDQRIGTLQRGAYAGTYEDYQDYVDLWEIYLPRRRLVVTLADQYLSGAAAGGDGKALRTQRWIGPDNGPYYMLGYGVVPGNAMPKAPIQDLIDLHLATNRTLRKMIRSVDRTKENTLVAGGADADGGRLLTANDGDIIRVDNPERLKQIVSGGSSIQLLTAVQQLLKGEFSFMGGNLELLGGRGPQSKTATQDEMLNQNAGAGVADMQATTVDFVSRVLKGLCWYWTNDPYSVHESTHTVNGLAAASITRRVTPEQRKGLRFEDMDVSVDPFSMQHWTPQSRMGQLSQFMQTTIIPLLPLLQQQGVSVDLQKYLQKAADYMDMPDLADILTIQAPPQRTQDAGGDSGGTPAAMPQQTTRTYNRVSTPGRTDQGDRKNLVSSLLGVNPGGNPETSRNGAMPMGASR